MDESEKRMSNNNVAIYSYGERILKDRIKNGTPEEQLKHPKKI